MRRRSNKKRNTLTLIAIIILLAIMAYMTISTSRANYEELNNYYQQLSVDEAE